MVAGPRRAADVDFARSGEDKDEGGPHDAVSSTLRAILQMRRTGADGEALPPHAYVFGNELGERVQNVKHAWERALLKAHGHAPRYRKKTIGQGKDAVLRSELRLQADIQRNRRSGRRAVCDRAGSRRGPPPSPR